MPADSNFPLIVEPHPSDYNGLPFITLIQYSKQAWLTIIDNVDKDCVRAFVLDLCGPESVDEDLIVGVAHEWYATLKGSVPLSVEFARRGLTATSSKIYRTLNLEYVSRIIGPVISYPTDDIKRIKRRRRRPLLVSVK